MEVQVSFWGICILCMMYDINKGMSYYTEHTQAYYFCRYILWYICIAPCLLEPSMTKHNSTLYLLLPASAFEKFLHLWMKYILILPIFCIILILGMKGYLPYQVPAICHTSVITWNFI